ncbi:hypothetical protein ABUW04_01680 [Streptacidiphilus sp. N1-10]|uniref:Uncharacterized protein n=1 Tax=Streptacidiphilus jeojiensis TaxID=3229225 RepID=A0ABV6XFC1_9ACTN
MAIEVFGPAWAMEGLGVRAGRYPLSVEGPVMRAVDHLVPGMSTVTRYIRYHSLYAAIAANSLMQGLDVSACRRLVRRCEVLMAALQCTEDMADDAWSAHGVDRVRGFCGDDVVQLARAADEEGLSGSYSPRRWGFWDQYGGPATVLGTVAVRDGVLVPGRHPFPDELQRSFAPLLALAEPDEVPLGGLDAARAVALGITIPAEQEWLMSALTATREGRHDPGVWEPTDLTRRATLRVLGRAIDLHGWEGDGYQETLCSAVVFGGGMSGDPVLAEIPEALGWRGLLLRNYSVGAWRKLWAALVGQVGSKDGEADRTAAELRAWLADQAPRATLRGTIDELLPLWDGDGDPLPVERDLLEAGGDPMTMVRLLLVGALRSRPGGLSDDVRAVYLGRRRHGGEFLDPTWVDGLVTDYLDRPTSDLAERLVDDMLAQAQRVALAKVRTDLGTGHLRIFSRLHVRNERYFKTGDEGATDIGTRVYELGFFGEQLGLFTVQDDCYVTTPAGRAILDLAL